MSEQQDPSASPSAPPDPVEPAQSEPTTTDWPLLGEQQLPAEPMTKGADPDNVEHR